MKTAMDTAMLFDAIGLIFSNSQAGSDIDERYELGANSHLRKPGNLSNSAPPCSRYPTWVSSACHKEKQ
jgi:hypothetical protein